MRRLTVPFLVIFLFYHHLFSFGFGGRVGLVPLSVSWVKSPQLIPGVGAAILECPLRLLGMPVSAFSEAAAFPALPYEEGDHPANALPSVATQFFGARI